MARFKPGQSGNPRGRPKVPEEVKELARCYTEEAIEAQVEVMRNADAPAAARVTAAENILNRAWGKPEGTTNLLVGAGQTFIDLLRVVSEQRALQAPPNEEAKAVH